jgi:hypothetical protein
MSEHIYDNLYLFTTDKIIEFIVSLFNLMNIKPIREIMSAIAARSPLQDLPVNWNLTFSSAEKLGEAVQPRKNYLISTIQDYFETRISKVHRLANRFIKNNGSWRW